MVLSMIEDRRGFLLVVQIYVIPVDRKGNDNKSVEKKDLAVIVKSRYKM